MSNNTISPCLDNIETLGIKIEPLENNIEDFKARTKWNRNRGNKITTKARQNDDTYQQLHNHILLMDSESKAFAPFLKARRDLQNCCRHTLVRRWKAPYSVDFISAHTCKNKICNVCNYVRSKALRRKFIKYFDKNEMVNLKTGEIHTKKDFDFFHLTLTVPHTAKKGWRGKKVFVKEIMEEFNFMRKKKFWKENIFAGEFGVEFTRNENGFHIHIHSLVIAHTSRGNRNYLYKEILKAWNKQTICPYNKRKEFTEKEIEAIKKGCKSFTDEDIKELHPQGSTFVSLESLYTLSDKKLSRYDRQNEEGKWKHYINPSDEKQFISGVMECIKYHFEPLCFNKEDKTIDFQLLEELLPEIHGKPLYRKFGNFHGLKELNINENLSNEIADEVIENLEETAREKATHPETGLEAQPGDFDFLIINARMLRYDKENNYKPHIVKSAKKIHLSDCNNIVQALKRMCNMGWKQQLKAKTTEQMILMSSAVNENYFEYHEPLELAG
jgi:hypothetical protein